VRQWNKPCEVLPDRRSMVRVITTDGVEFLGEFDSARQEFVDRTSDRGWMPIGRVELWSWANSTPLASAGLRLANVA
jgi:hypothetical protein